MQLRRLYRCEFVDGQITRLTPALDDDYADCTANLYAVIATGIDHPQVNAVVRCAKHDGGELLAAHFEAGEILVRLHPEAVVGRVLAEAQADELLDWSGVAAKTDGDGIIVQVMRVRTVD